MNANTNDWNAQAKVRYEAHIAVLERQIELFSSGTLQIRKGNRTLGDWESNNREMIETLRQTIEHFKQLIAGLDKQGETQ